MTPTSPTTKFFLASLAQIEVGTPAPTTRAMAMVYGPLVTAFEQVYTETATSAEALDGANTELISLIEGLQRAAPPPSNEGYRTVEVNFTTDGSVDYEVLVDGDDRHSIITTNTSRTSTLPAYDSCRADGEEMAGTSSLRFLPPSASSVQCTLTGMVPNTEHQVSIMGDSGAVFTAVLSTNVGDVVPTAGDTSPVLFALGAIFLSLVALLSYGRVMDVRAGRLHAKSAHLYIAPAMFALAMLTFYPVLYGFWLSFTDADATHLGSKPSLALPTSSRSSPLQDSFESRSLHWCGHWRTSPPTSVLACSWPWCCKAGQSVEQQPTGPCCCCLGPFPRTSPCLSGRGCSNPRGWSTTFWEQTSISSPTPPEHKSL